MSRASKLISVTKCLAAVALCVGVQFRAAIASAQVIVDSGGFESYTLGGHLENESGWASAGGIASSATIVDTVVESGFRSVQVTRAANSDRRWAVPVGGMGHPENRYITVEWDMNVTGTGAHSVFGPFLGVDTYDDTVTPRVLGSLGVDATTGDVLYQLGGTGVLEETGTVVGFGQWHHYQLRLDFLQNRYSVRIDNGNRTTTSFVDGPASSFTDADIAAFAASFDAGSQSQSGTAYFDNFIVRNIVPGDFDFDGDVDTADLTFWKLGFNTNSQGDADYDGDTDGRDYLIWQKNFGSGIPLSAAVAAVPEPATLFTGALALCFLALRRRVDNR